LKLLFDQNLPDKLVISLQDIFPNSRHVKRLQLSNVPDREVWNFVKQNGFTIISKNSYFHQMSFVFGAPPKVVWLRIGNSSTKELEISIRANLLRISNFGNDTEAAMLVLG
jgi:predicted nuclease of predicted toxin-antitoxin system